jgi:hypothetical protein
LRNPNLPPDRATDTSFHKEIRSEAIRTRIAQTRFSDVYRANNRNGAGDLRRGGYVSYQNSLLFGQIDKRFDQMEKRLEDLKEENEKRYDQMEKRFADLNQVVLSDRARREGNQQ